MPETQEPVSIAKDQNGVVWFPGGLMSKRAYEELQKKNGGIKYEDLPVIDSHNQNIIEVD